jgi:hypothetical protein
MKALRRGDKTHLKASETYNPYNVYVLIKMAPGMIAFLRKNLLVNLGNSLDISLLDWTEMLGKILPKIHQG